MALLGLIADYSSSDDDQEEVTLQQKLNSKEIPGTNFLISEEGIDREEKKVKKCKKSKKEKLVNPAKGLREIDKSDLLPSPFTCTNTSSVFYNPFHQEQEAKKSMLEKHVKLTNNPKDVLEINGRKICFNYRKGRCKFGHNCKYAHDSDLSVEAIKVTDQHRSDADSSAHYNSAGNAQPMLSSDEMEAIRKRKPGLSEGLVPNKKSRKNFSTQQHKEAPWLHKR
ncbi:hypothetical protein HAZT_HAZT008483 [Hyalella azteca]|uniref:Uncharacterized protein LOC108667286 n=1 Tax=Hyalella azteca TaxID=294128 RepID=A0A6A0H8K6_HYAAZ|nr:uncharacterized protein LOC108667286 [Hyalella azteca]XP_018009782.1 uncharacterized protein LOC108667286 [Hyalella azteca]XP_018009784.1 uncharacterized protein LOC108667286 [Hyalella azteca]KAA0202093.1 hypothetical protein HAZT_HAZT008483 [Hyalella azteca]